MRRILSLCCVLFLCLGCDLPSRQVAQTVTPISKPGSRFVVAQSALADGLAPLALSLRAFDAHGDPLAATAVSIDAGEGVLLSPALGTTDGSGAFQAIARSRRAGTQTFRATFAGQVLTATGTFTAGAPARAASSLSARQAFINPDGLSTAVFTLSLIDANGNAVPGAAVSITSSVPGDRPSPSAGTTDSTGVLAVSLSSTEPGWHALTAASGDVVLASGVTFSRPPSAARSHLSLSPVIANGTSPAALLLSLNDDQGSPVPGAPVSFAAAGAIILPETGWTDANGLFSAQLTSAETGLHEVAANLPEGFTLTAPQTFLSAPSPTKSVLDVGYGYADGVTPIPIVVRARDANGLPIPGLPVSLSIAAAGATLTPASGTTDSAGNFSASLIARFPGSPVLTAQLGGITLSSPIELGTPGAAVSQCTFVLSKPQAIADGVDTIVMTGTINDAYGDPLPATSVDISSNDGTSYNGRALTDAAGQFQVSVTSTVAGPVLLYFVLDTFGTHLAPPVEPLFVAGPATKVSIGATSALVKADGISLALFSVFVADKEGNGVPAAPVAITSSEPSDDPSISQGMTDSGGGLSFTLASTVAGYHMLTATSGALVGGGGVTFGNGPSAQTSKLTITPSTIFADGVSAALITVKVRDAANVPVPGAVVTLEPPYRSVLTVTSGPADADGVFTSALTTVGFTSGPTQALIAKIGSVALQGTITALGGPPVAAHSGFSVPAAVPSDGVARATAKLSLRDASSNVTPTIPVTFTADPALQIVSAAATTGTDGVARLVITSTHPGTFPISATAYGLSFTASIVFSDTLPSQANSSWTLSDSSLPTDAHSLAVGLLRLRDSANRPIPGIAVPQLTEELHWSGTLQTETDAQGEVRYELVCLEEALSGSISFNVGGLSFAAPLACTHSGWERAYNAAGAPIRALFADDADGVTFAASINGVYRLTNGGPEYMLIPDEASPGHFDATCLAADPPSRSVYACGGGALQISRDLGWTWAASSALTGVTALAVDPSAGNIVYALAGGLLSTSLDSASTFAAAASGPHGLAGVTVGPEGTAAVWSGSSVWLSHDAGATWVRGGALSGSVSELVFAPGGGDLALYAATASGLFRSSDGGATFQPVGPDPFGGRAVGQLAIDSASPQSLFALVGGQLFSSTNGGASWLPLYSSAVGGAATQPGTALAILHSGVHAEAYEATSLGVLGYNYLGLTWQPFTFGQPMRAMVSQSSTAWALTPAGLTSNNAGQVANPCDASSLSKLVTVGVPNTPNPLLALCGDGTMWSFTSNQTGWAALTPGGTNFAASSLLYAGTALVALSAATGAAFSSTDTGKTWTPFAAGHAGLWQLASALYPGTTEYLLTASGILASADSGATWTQRGPLPGGVDSTALAFAVDPVDASSLWLTSASGLLHSADGGATWQSIILPSPQPIVAFAVDSSRQGTAWLVQDGRIFVTADRGATWAVRMAGVIGAVNSLVVVRAPADTLFAGTDSEGLFMTSTAGQ
jgi:hypothetical protein